MPQFIPQTLLILLHVWHHHGLSPLSPLRIRIQSDDRGTDRGKLRGSYPSHSSLPLTLSHTQTGIVLPTKLPIPG